MSIIRINIFLITLMFVFQSCSNESKPKELKKTSKSIPWIKGGNFNSDSAYQYIAKQVSFGPRVPNTKNHQKCGDWLVKKLLKLGYNVKEQKGEVTAFNGSKLPVRNIIANLNDSLNKKVLLCAHWDTRPFADRDSVNVNKPIIGANDGASGVGVILEIARNIILDSINTAVEIIFFDVEDYGTPITNNSFFDLQSMNDTWCLGSQFWCYNLNNNYKRPNFGILLDMVGAKNAVFPKEEISRQFAGYHLNKIWKLADFLGYSKYFQKKIAPPITDDHTYINQLSQIPTLDVIHYDVSPYSGRFDFGKFHHTHNDNLSIIDKTTLKAVGQTILSYLYNI